MKSNRNLVPAISDDWFSDISKFYRWKHSVKGSPVFSCKAAESFPNEWLKAFENGVWDEPGILGDNFRSYFDLKLP